MFEWSLILILNIILPGMWYLTFLEFRTRMGHERVGWSSLFMIGEDLFVNTEWWYGVVVPRVSLDKFDIKLTAFFTLYLNGLIFVWSWKYAEAIFRPSSCTCCSSLVFCHHGGCGPRDSAGMAPDGSGRGEGHAADRPGTAVYVTADVRQCGQSVWKVIPHLDQ